MKIKVGIVGYGNLGKAVENNILFDKKFKLIAIFSKRNIISRFNSKIVNIKEINKYKKKIDILFLCGGSKNDIEQIIFDLAKYFNTVNCFDTHKNISKISMKLNEICKKNKTVSIMSCGWDPGIFSLIRTLCFILGDKNPATFWGKGISMGHSDAIRQIENVNDAVQFTVPNKDAINCYQHNGEEPFNIPKHSRICYVCANKKYHKRITTQIKNMPNYFKGQPTKVHFVSKNKVQKLKQKLSHKGVVLSKINLENNESCKLSFNLEMTSNAYLTARIMTTYSISIKSLKQDGKFGCYNIFEIPFSKLLNKKKIAYVKNNLI